MLVELNRCLNDSGAAVADLKFTPENLAKLVKMSDDGVISKNAAKDVLRAMFETGSEPEAIAKEQNLIMSNDTGELEAIVDKVIAENMDSVESYKSGNQKVFGFLMGQVIRYAGKGANMQAAKDILTKKIN